MMQRPVACNNGGEEVRVTESHDDTDNLFPHWLPIPVSFFVTLRN